MSALDQIVTTEKKADAELLRAKDEATRIIEAAKETARQLKEERLNSLHARLEQMNADMTTRAHTEETQILDRAQSKVAAESTIGTNDLDALAEFVVEEVIHGNR
ncbi:hypothetical protein O6R05_07560 [Peptoniphilus equinus]|uniref:V/A-type H+-transporting ATPase subunit G/H n=1 Tax=Peptoniphilus equinus TaxID=3016343 RepID=A0ABY7QST2_9FIRM|nr:V-type ATPase subunit subunit G family protein [Peptoniphilus equinus]WBW49849.1 hypothetical protein O6R05_07560 [Peptoniphilus equinus]